MVGDDEAVFAGARPVDAGDGTPRRLVDRREVLRLAEQVEPAMPKTGEQPVAELLRPAETFRVEDVKLFPPIAVGIGGA